jgi:hypothetical protein
MIIQESEDGDFYIKDSDNKHLIKFFNPTLKFGPLETTLFQLFENGFYLEVGGFASPRVRYKLRLTRGRESYLLGRITLEEIKQADSLSEFVVHGFRPILRLDRMDQQLENPWKRLLAKYPAPKKPEPMIGNRTLSEVIKDQLEETFGD